MRGSVCRHLQPCTTKLVQNLKLLQQDLAELVGQASHCKIVTTWLEVCSYVQSIVNHKQHTERLFLLTKLHKSQTDKGTATPDTSPPPKKKKRVTLTRLWHIATDHNCNHLRDKQKAQSISTFQSTSSTRCDFELLPREY